MVPALERFVIGIAVELVHDRLELPAIDGFEEIPKDAIPKAHARPFCVSTTRKDRCESVRPSMHRDIVNQFPRTALRARRGEVWSKRLGRCPHEYPGDETPSCALLAAPL